MPPSHRQQRRLPRPSRRWAPAVAALIALALPSVAGATSGWTVVATPNPAGTDGYNALNGVAVVSATNAWSVGLGRVNRQGTVPFRPLIEHWDGTAWRSAAAAALPAGVDGRLQGVAAVAADDIWAVGQRTTATAAHSLIEHWDGSHWTLVAPPAADPLGAGLNAVAASGPSDVWAVGSQAHAGGNRTPLAEHWDGAQWSVVATPTFPNASHVDLNGVAAFDAHHAWIVGTAGGQHPDAMIEGWNGSSWTVASSPPTRFYSELYGVAARSTSDVWAVGFEGVTDPLVEHWNGSSWTVVTSPLPPGSSNNSVLQGVAAFSSNDVWAVGQVLALGAWRSSLAEHWDGQRWTIVSTPPRPQAELASVAGIAGSTLWAVGSQQVQSGATLTLGMRNSA